MMEAGSFGRIRSARRVSDSGATAARSLRVPGVNLNVDIDPVDAGAEGMAVADVPVEVDAYTGVVDPCGAYFLGAASSGGLGRKDERLA
jgi:hypothetical protein